MALPLVGAGVTAGRGLLAYLAKSKAMQEEGTGAQDLRYIPKYLTEEGEVNTFMGIPKRKSPRRVRRMCRQKNCQKKSSS